MAKKYAVYSGTREVYSQMIASIKSLVYNSDVDKIFLLIEDDTFPEPLPSCIETINVSGQRYFAKDGPNFKCQWSYMVLLRAAYCHLLSVDKVLSLDIDTIVNKDVSPLWNYDISDYYLAGVAEPKKADLFKTGLYVNMGVTLHNLAKLRDGKADQIIDILNKDKFSFPEQDAFNIYCAGKILELPPEYNSSICTKTATEAWITHYAAEPFTKWKRRADYRKYSEMPWKVALGRGK